MGRIDNDETKGVALSFIILAHVRTGGTFCAHALSNHPQIHCDRGESIHHLSVWRQAGIKPGGICRLLWNQTGYQASGFRLIYNQAFHERVWPDIEDVQPHIIHLQRRSLVRQALSQAYQQRVRAGALEYHPVHTFEEREPPKQAMDPKQAVYFTKKLARECKQGKQRVAQYDGPTLDVWYEDMVANTGGSATAMNKVVAKDICEFLEVDGILHLPVGLKRDFPVPTPQMFSNWKAIEEALRKEGYGEDVDYELEYWRKEARD